MGNLISRDGAETLRELINNARDKYDIQMDEMTIKSMLSLVAQRLHSCGRNVTIVAVGGAVNTALLRSRPTTGDVDFFYSTKLKSDESSAVVNAAKWVAEELDLHETWLNNHTELTVNALYEEAVDQNAKIFQAAGLTVLAAPWRYAITAKLDRLMKSGHKTYDLSDAVEYLYQIVSASGGRPVPRVNLQKWAEEFKCVEPDSTLVQRFGDAYLAKFSTAGLS